MRGIIGSGILSFLSSGSGNVNLLTKFKAADTSRSNNTVSDDPDLVFTALAAGTYYLMGYLAFSADGTNGIRASIHTSQALATSFYNFGRTQVGSTAYNAVLTYTNPSTTVTGTRLDDASGNNGTVLVEGFLIIPSSTDIALQWAEVNTGSPAAIFRQGSWLSLFKMN